MDVVVLAIWSEAEQTTGDCKGKDQSASVQAIAGYNGTYNRRSWKFATQKLHAKRQLMLFNL